MGAQMLNAQSLASILFLTLHSASIFAATAIPVDPPRSSQRELPTYTLLYEVESPQLTLVTILGGEGRIGVSETTKDTRTQTALMVKHFVRKDFITLRVNVVIFDSPVELYPVRMREDNEHLNRVESVVRFYRDRFNVPVWLLGHSNGSISVTEYLARKHSDTPVAGAILSSSVYRLTLKEELNVPLLFLHHENDECRETPFSYARSNFETARRLNKAYTDLSVVRSGQSHGDPCRDGKHMYYGAYEEAAKQLAGFLDKVTQNK
jgi:hypothetical protein